MFVQVIRGRVSDREGARAALDRWQEQLSDGAAGWLGSTAGVTEDGELVGIVRFESQEAARRNSDRPEQGEWWSETSRLFESEPRFFDSVWVETDLVGDPDRAGFVQVIQAATTDPDRARGLMGADPAFAEFRPDILGSVTAEHDGGLFTTAIWFTSEAEAREGERKEMPPELAAQFEEMQSLSSGPPEFLDLKEPWLYAPR